MARINRRLILFAALFQCLLIGIEFQEPPKWVKPLEIVQNEKTNVHLINRQVSQTEEFQQFAFTVTEPQKITIPFNPSFETVILNELTIVRNGEKIDIGFVKQTVKEETSPLIDDGMQSLTITIDDLKEKDLVIYSYTIKGRNPLFKGLIYFTQKLGFPFAVDRIYLRIVTKDLPCYHVHNTSQKPVIYDSEWAMDVTNEIDGSYVEVTQFKSWDEIADILLPHFALPDQGLPLVDRLIENCTTKNEKIAALLHFVQEEIRYYGIESGTLAYCPASPLEVLERGFGDCKEKTQLLRYLLAQINISSTPCLVSTDFVTTLPSPESFNHMILKIEEHFVDPTLGSYDISHYKFKLLVN